MKIIFLGPPGSGKGTQAEKLAKRLKVSHISTGDLFRDVAKNKTKLSFKVKNYLDKGLLVPDEITTDLVKERIKKKDCKNGYILDGFPRTLEQAKMFDKVDKVIYVSSSRKLIFKRLTLRKICPKCNRIYGMDNPPKNKGVCDDDKTQLYQRDDDMKEVIKKRLEVYEKETKPLLKYYNVIHIDGGKLINEVFEDILKWLKC